MPPNANQPIDYRIEKLNALSCPKGQTFTCELTGLSATVQLVTPYITLYYATREHAEQAWEGIICKIAPILGPLRREPPIIGSEEERARRANTLLMSKRALVDLTKNEASKFLVRGQYELAIPGALQALRFSHELFGERSIELVPSYLLLAEANLGLRRNKQAEEFLSLANWSVLKHPECSNAIRSQLHRNFGKLYASQGKYQEALRQLSNDVYYSSLEIGPEHVDTAGGYYHMANIFYSQNRIENALALYDKVVDIWYKFLASVRNNSEVTDVLGEAQLAEAMDMMQKILGMRKKILGEKHIATGEALYTQGLLRLFMGEKQASQEDITQAYDVYCDHLGGDHPSTKDVYDVLQQLNEEALFGPEQGDKELGQMVHSPIPMPPGTGNSDVGSL